MAGAVAGETVSCAAVRTAVALLTRQAIAPDVPREDVLGDVPPGDVLEVMEAITGGILAAVWSADEGADVLERIGLAVARMTGG